ncbi:MAG: hypothetical protein OQJ89_09020, partial [Kangiellaceae bacterium]|nr:hypothetical protein [Kangiellaceae bacterium]
AFVLSVSVVAVWFSYIDRRPIEVRVLASQDGVSKELQQLNQIFTVAIQSDDNFSVKPISITLTPTQAFAAPTLAWRQANLEYNQWLIWGQTYLSDHGIYLKYGLFRNDVYWHGFVFGKDASQLQDQLAIRVGQLLRMGLFSRTEKKFEISWLMQSLAGYPNDPDIQLLIAKHYIEVQQPDVALTYLEQLAASNGLEASNEFQANSAYSASAHWLIGKIYKMRGQHQQAANSLQAMKASLEHTNIWSLIFDNIKTNAWLAYDRTDYGSMFEILDRGVALSRKNADPLTQFKLHILYSILAQNALQHDKKYAQLNAAQAILIQHNLDQSNLAIVYYHFALFLKDKPKTIPYIEKILSLPRTEDNFWIQDDAFEKLVKFHIAHKEFERAHELLKEPGESPRKMRLKANLFLSQEKIDLARPLFQRSFDLARLNYDNQTGVQSALMLYQLTSDSKERAKYLAYLESNATPSWLKQHDMELASQ